MMSHKKIPIEKGSKIRQKLENLLENISNEVFHRRQKSVQANIRLYFTKQAERFNIPADQLKIIFYWQDNKVKAYCRCKDLINKELPVRTFIPFFVGAKMPILPALETDVNYKLKTFFQILAKQHQIQNEKQFIQLTWKDNEIKVELYYNGAFLREIPLKEMIQHFSQRTNIKPKINSME